MRREIIKIIPGSTPTLYFYLPCDAEVVADIWWKFEQRGRDIFTKRLKDMEIEGTRVDLTLTQEETLRFDGEQRVDTQAIIHFIDGGTIIPDPIRMEVGRLL